MSQHELASVAIVGSSLLVAETIKNAYNTTNVLRDLENQTNGHLRDNATAMADAVYQSGMADAEMTKNEAITAGVTAGCSGLSAVAMGSSLATPKGEAEEVNALDNLTRLKPSGAGARADDSEFGNNNPDIQDELKAALSTSRGLDDEGNVLDKNQKYTVENGKLKVDAAGRKLEDIYEASSLGEKTAFTKNVNKELDARRTALSSAKQTRANVINSFTEMSKSICNIGGQSANSAVRANKAGVDKSNALYNSAQDLLKPVDQKLSQELDGANADAKQAARALIDQMNNLNARG